MVIHGLEDAGPDDPKLEALRRAAVASRDAVTTGDLALPGRAMQENSEAQRALHPALISRDAQQML